MARDSCPGPFAMKSRASKVVSIFPAFSITCRFQVFTVDIHRLESAVEN